LEKCPEIQAQSHWCECKEVSPKHLQVIFHFARSWSPRVS